MRPRAIHAAIAAVVLVGALVGGAASTAASAHPAQVVTAWNLKAVQALANPPSAGIPGAGQPPPVAAIHLAMVQGAVYDAVNSIVGGYQPYLEGLPDAPSDASQAAAVVTAAHHVLVGLPLPVAVTTWLDADLATALGAIAPGAQKDAGIAAGSAAAAAMLADRAGDGRFGAFRFTNPTDPQPGEWRTVPPAFGNDPNAWVARVRPFTLRSTSQYRTEGPFALDSAEYAAEFEEVKAYGSLNSTVRSADQTAMAFFYTDSPPAMWNRVFSALAEEHSLSIAQAARLFALTNLAMGDGLIGCWDDKAHWSFWRPISAIRLADTDGNPATEADPTWQPLVGNPPYPDHPSGYNCATGAAMYAARGFFGTDKVAFTAHSNAAGAGPDRSYARFSDVLADTIDARIFLGIHFRAPDAQGAWLGKKVGQWVSNRYLRPVH
jgi:hypothetical protein